MDKDTRNVMKNLLVEYEDRLPEDAKVMDLGSYDVNGSFKPLMRKGWQYLGVDRVCGPNVDALTIDEYKLPCEAGAMDLIISSSCLQYVRNPFKMMESVYESLSPFGMVIVCAAATERPGLISLSENLCPNGDIAFDCWRILKDGMRELLEASRFNVERVFYSGSNCWGIGTK